MKEFKSPLTEADFLEMREIAERCEVRRPFIGALDDLGIETAGLSGQNDAQQKFCTRCRELHDEGKL